MMPESFSDLNCEISARRPFAESYSEKDYNSIKQQFSRAKEFAHVAEEEFKQGKWPTFMENAHAAAEFLAKTEMVLIGHLRPEGCDKMSHKDVLSAYSECVQQNKVTRELLDTLDYLYRIRHEAKFPNKVATVDDEKASCSMDVIRRKRTYLESQMKKSV
ncbi:MAG: HEPN domain-containing protein [Planctomycetes bacterium]|nr:HEPN domain-containing protein [Planctomycetota bacterium]